MKPTDWQHFSMLACTRVKHSDSVSTARRDRAAEPLKASGVGHQAPERVVAVLRGIAGAKSAHRDLVPVWTMQGHEANLGHLTNQFHDVVAAARIAVTCATYNFSPTSSMWDALRVASDEPDVAVCVYVDGEVGDPAGVKERLPRADSALRHHYVTVTIVSSPATRPRWSITEATAVRRLRRSGQRASSTLK